MVSTPLLDARIESVRRQFPLLSNSSVAYLDNAATTQKPAPVLETMDRYWNFSNANVHRGVYRLSQDATNLYEGAREKVQKLLGAKYIEEIVFTKGCTESLNLLASSLASRLNPANTGNTGDSILAAGDVILVSEMEHHANIVPWQMAASAVGATVIPIPITPNGEIDLDEYRRLLKTHPVKIVAIVHVSNSLGTVNPVKELVRLAHESAAIAVVDGAQAVAHMSIDVQDIDADFYAISGHKMYGPTGIGVLYGKRDLLSKLPAYQGGGDMIYTVSFEKETTYAPIPGKFEAGTPNIAGAIGLGAAVDYIESLNPTEDGNSLSSGYRWISAVEEQLKVYANDQLQRIPGLVIRGTAEKKAAVFSFTMDSAHPHDIGTILDAEGVAVRTGHHCCMPLMKRLGVPATARASLSFYNTTEDIDRLTAGLEKVRKIFS